MAQISFIESKLLSLSFQTDLEGLKDGLSIKHNNGYSEDDNKSFIVRFNIDVTSKSGISISLEYAGLFESDTEIPEDFQNSSFPTVNAPAIVFPYLRSFLSTFTLNAGLDPITLPTINFKSSGEKNNEDS